MNRRLYRSADDRILAGVAGGIAETYDFDPALVRVAWALLTLFTGGVFLILYIVMALAIPLAPDLAPGMGGVWPAAAPVGTETNAGGAAETGPPTQMSERERRRVMRQARRGAGDGGGALVLGLILILVGGVFLLNQLVPAFNWGQVWPFALIALGAVLVVAAFVPRTRA